ncbi:MAG: hypothetical protein QM760_21910 [Nibricoccus sp.]
MKYIEGALQIGDHYDRVYYRWGSWRNEFAVVGDVGASISTPPGFDGDGSLTLNDVEHSRPETYWQTTHDSGWETQGLAEEASEGATDDFTILAVPPEGGQPLSLRNVGWVSNNVAGSPNPTWEVVRLLDMPSVSIAAIDANANEPPSLADDASRGEAQFRITRTGELDGPLTVQLFLPAGTAVLGAATCCPKAALPR